MGADLTPLGAPPSLPDGEVHLWAVKLDLGRSYEELLAPDERARARRLVSADAKARFAAARAALRTLLGAYAGVAPGALTFGATTHGKPHLNDPTWLRFSLARSDELALVGVSKGLELGVDVERRRAVENAAALAARYLTTAEARELAALPAAAQPEAFLRCWTLKEAVLKATGEGLSRALDSFRVVVKPDKSARLLDVPQPLGPPENWLLRELEPAPGYLGAVAVLSRACRLRCFTLRV